MEVKSSSEARFSVVKSEFLLKFLGKISSPRPYPKRLCLCNMLVCKRCVTNYKRCVTDYKGCKLQSVSERLHMTAQNESTLNVTKQLLLHRFHGVTI